MEKNLEQELTHTVEGLPPAVKAIKIREDVETIARMPSDKFDEWYHGKKNATELLLTAYQSFGEIPDLNYENGSHTMGEQREILDKVSTLKTGLEYLEQIKRLHEGYKRD